MKDLKDFKVNKLGNFIFNNLKINVLDVNDENVDLFNDILNKLRNNKDYTEVERNEKCRLTFYDICFKLPCYCYFYTNSFAELFIADIDGIYRIQLKHVPYDDKDKPVWGRKAFSQFEKMLEEDGINLKDYAIENGKEVKEEIEMPLIKLGDFAFTDAIYKNCHHIDFHNSYPGGLAITHPEFRPTIEKLYKQRKENEIYKSILNLSIGYMQSRWISYKYAHLSRDAINNNNERVRTVAKDLEDNGRLILLYNTDGIWYSGDIWHGNLEGKNVGEWENDHTNCTLRIKSAGSYEFIEDGKYNPVVRGYTNYDKEKPRENWEWGDIYKTGANSYIFTPDGIIKQEGDVINER